MRSYNLIILYGCLDSGIIINKEMEEYVDEYFWTAHHGPVLARWSRVQERTGFVVSCMGLTGRYYSPPPTYPALSVTPINTSNKHCPLR